ncbi:unnamed protein product [Rhizoctonia solani]|uniref:Peptidase S54 rhomboid domain-containing protein n=1 Tax=Rhizoctonia solani TaxID=456999 RepID=A0A8H3H717_9AGAM|nr:unnamed protein product [Rhizoctonia solani]
MSGFQNAPITKGLMIATGALSLIVGLADARHYFHLQLSPHISRDHQYWRLLTNQLAFINSSELLLGQIMFYNVAVGIERTFGSHKYFSFLVAAALVSTLLNFSSLLALYRFGLNYIPAGPVAIIFAILYQYERIVPSAYNFRILGITMSNKTFTYLTAFPIIISHMPGSILVALTGLATGALYRSDITNLKSYRAPPWVVSVVSSLIGSSRPPHLPKTFTYLIAFPITISHMPGSMLVALTGLATGALYRSDITNLKSYRAPPWFVSAISSLVGSSRPAHMPRRAIPGERPPFATEQVLTRRRVNEPREEDNNDHADGATAAGTARSVTGSGSGSVMREWVNELTGRRDGARVPTATEIAELTSVFPHASREEIIAALQRSQTVDQAASILLTGSS